MHLENEITMRYRFAHTFKRWDLILFLFWAIVQAWLLHANGINVHGESARMIREAGNLSNHGYLSTPIYFMYLTEIMLIYIKLKLGIGFSFVIVVQLVFNLFALFYLFKFLSGFYTSPFLAFVGCLLIIICIPYQVYNTFLYTESIFFSLTVIYSCYLLSISKYSASNILILVSLMILLCLTRPTGIFFIMPTSVYLFVQLTGKMKLSLRIAIFLAVSLAFIWMINLAMGTGGGIDILLPFREEHIICDVPTVAGGTGVQNAEDNSLHGLFSWISAHPAQFFRLAWLRSKAFFGLARTYYSGTHNIMLGTFFYMLYLLIFLAVVRFKKHTPIAFLYFSGVVFIYWLAVIFSCDEWNNRFFLTLTPFFIIQGWYFFKKK